MSRIRITFAAFAAAIAIAAPAPAAAQFNLGRALGAAVKTAKAVTLSDKQVASYVRQSIDAMDRQNKVSAPDSKYTVRLNRLTKGLDKAGGMPLNFKVYEVTDINAFACPDGSVRVFSALMDIMTDEELMGVIGHEIGHVELHHSKKAMRAELLTGAAKDAISSTGGLVAKLTDSQLGAIGEKLVNAKYSQKQENEADDAGYNFLVKNGINPWGMAMAFEKLQSDESLSNFLQKMFSSHPDTKSRIKRIAERCAADGYKRP